MIILRLGGGICSTKRIPLCCCSVQSRITPPKTEKNNISGEQLKSELRGGGAPASASSAGTDTNNGGGVEVPRQKYIATSKSDLLHAVVMDKHDDTKQQFLLLSSYAHLLLVQSL